MSNTDAQRRPVFIDRRNNRLFADPLIGNGAWPEVLITPGMFGEFPANTILGRQGTSGNASALSADVTIDLLNTATTSVIGAARVAAASTTGAGVVQLNDATNSTSTTTAATANAVKSAYDLANAAIPKAGGTFTGPVTFNENANLGQLNGDCLAGLRNRVINGGMRVCQRSTSTAISALDAAGVYTVDRWRAINNTDATFTVSQSTDVPAGQGFTNSLLVTVNTADTSIGATQRASIEQRIEGYRVADLAYGTASAKSTILSFWVKATAAVTYGLSIRNAGSGATRSYNASYSVNAPNTWEKKTILITGDTAGTWNTGNGVGLNITFSLGAGGNAQGAPFWQAGDTDGVTGAALFPISAASATWAITGVQLETGSVSATPFERRPMTLEMALCQRYFWKTYNTVDPPGLATANGSLAEVAPNSGEWRANACFKVTMRSTPAVLNVYSTVTGVLGTYRDVTAGVDRALTTFNAGEDNALLGGTAGSQSIVRFHVTAEAEL